MSEAQFERFLKAVFYVPERSEAEPIRIHGALVSRALLHLPTRRCRAARVSVNTMRSTTSPRPLCAVSSQQGDDNTGAKNMNECFYNVVLSAINGPTQDEARPRAHLKPAHSVIQQWINPCADEGMWAAAAQEEEQPEL